MVSIFTLSVVMIILLIGLSLYAVRIYCKALELNPKNRELDQILNEIAQAQITIESLKNEIGAYETEKQFALDIIKKKEAAENFLQNHASLIETKKGEIAKLEALIDGLSNETSSATAKLQDIMDEKKNVKAELEDVMKQVAQENVKYTTLQSEYSSLEKRKTDLESAIKRLEEQEEKIKDSISKLKSDLSDLEKKKEERESLERDIVKYKTLRDDLTAEVSAKSTEYAGTVKAEELVAKQRWDDLDRPYIIANKRNKGAIKESDWLNEFKENLGLSRILCN